jgi:hypothetical protein
MFMQDVSAFDTAQSVDLESFMKKAATRQAGLVAGTRVEAAQGWRPVESLTRGDAVFTLDGGLTEITGLRRETIVPRQIIHVAGGTLGNCDALTLLPFQHLLIHAPVGERAFGMADLLVPAQALAGLDGVEWRTAPELVELVHLEFEDEELVWANSGMLVHCVQAGRPAGQSSFFKVLEMDQALALVQLMRGATQHFAVAA